MKWSEVEKENIIKLLLSVDESNRTLALQILNPSNVIDEFIPVIYFLYICDYDLEVNSDFLSVFKKLSKTHLTEWNRKAGFLKDIFSIQKSNLKEAIQTYEQEAMELFDNFFCQSPQNVHIYNSLGNLLKNLGMKKNALVYLKKAAEYDPTSYSYNFDYAYNLPENKKNAQISLKHYQKCLSIKDVGIAPYHNMGRIYTHQLGDYEKASEIMREGLLKYPDATDTMIEIALAEENMGNLKTARTFLENAIEKNPYNDLAHNNLAFMLWQHFKEYNLAKNHIEKALELKPKDGLFWHTLAEVEWYGFQNREKALEALYNGKKVQKSYKGGDEMIKELEILD